MKKLTTEELEQFCLGCEHDCDRPCGLVMEEREARKQATQA